MTTQQNKEGLEARLLDIVRADADEAILADNYITLVEAASELSSLREENERLRKEKTEIAMTALAADGQAQEAFVALSASQAQLKIYREALEPFGTYLDEVKIDLNNKGEPLPDADGVGWVYLTIGDFRRARTTLSQEAGE